MDYSAISFRIARGVGEREESPQWSLYNLSIYIQILNFNLLIGQFDLTHVKKVELESPDMFENHPWLPTGHKGMFICSKLGQNLSQVRTFVRKQRVTNLGPFASF